MSGEPFFPYAQKRIPFTLAGRQGQVAVYYGPNDDAVKVGFDATLASTFLSRYARDTRCCRRKSKAMPGPAIARSADGSRS